jgi:hypothetical protein
MQPVAYPPVPNCKLYHEARLHIVASYDLVQIQLFITLLYAKHVSFIDNDLTKPRYVMSRYVTLLCYVM